VILVFVTTEWEEDEDGCSVSATYLEHKVQEFVISKLVSWLVGWLSNYLVRWLVTWLVYYLAS
jgi:hypothetical protein